MTGEEFKAWRKEMKLSQERAGEELGVGRKAIAEWERGVRYEDGRPAKIPPYIALACAAIYHRLPGYTPVR